MHEMDERARFECDLSDVHYFVEVQVRPLPFGRSQVLIEEARKQIVV